MSKTPIVHQCELPADSLLWKWAEPDDFLDCFVIAAVVPPRRAAEIITAFPLWARILLKVRGMVAFVFGLSTDGPDVVDKVGPFPVEIETSEEVIAGFNDKHLNFRVSVIAKDRRVSLATWVHVHNLGGRLYLLCIMPFHILIAKDALRRVSSHAAADVQRRIY
ncbi:MAG: DUF2867 domain-containing protein [Roseobacter sp.]|uniref:DUF2867 domain-containing protein n=1 Tax=Alphaproteobacteria TaxID=28211 RepID=UPI003264223C